MGNCGAMFVQRPKKNALVINLLLVLKTSEFKGRVGLPRTEEKIHDGAESPDQRRTKEPKRDELVRNVPPVLRNHVKRPDPTTMKRRFIHYGKNVKRISVYGRKAFCLE
jgi:hypothetical protein